MKFSKFALGALAALFASVALASAFYVGYNPLTGANGVIGIPVATGALPTISGCSYTNQVGGAGVFSFAAGATSCTVTVTIPFAAPNGVFCVASDETTVADTMKQSAHTTTSCTLTGTVVSSDNILVEINAY